MNSTLKEKPATTKRSAKPKPTPSELIDRLEQYLDGQRLSDMADKILEKRINLGKITSLERYALLEITDHLYGQCNDVEATIRYLRTQLKENTDTTLKEKTTTGKLSILPTPTPIELANRLDLFLDSKELAAMAQSVLRERKKSGPISTIESVVWPQIINHLNLQYIDFKAAIRYLESKK